MMTRAILLAFVVISALVGMLFAPPPAAAEVCSCSSAPPSTPKGIPPPPPGWSRTANYGWGCSFSQQCPKGKSAPQPKGGGPAYLCMMQKDWDAAVSAHPNGKITHSFSSVISNSHSDFTVSVPAGATIVAVACGIEDEAEHSCDYGTQCGSKNGNPQYANTPKHFCPYNSSCYAEDHPGGATTPFYGTFKTFTMPNPSTLHLSYETGNRSPQTVGSMFVLYTQ